MSNRLRFIAKDHELDRAEAVEYPVLVAGAIVPEKNSVAVFESDKEFAAWARETKYAAKVAETSRLISEFPRVDVSDHQEARRFQAMTHETTRNLERLADKIGVPTWSDEVFAKAIEEGILRSSLIFRHINLGGDFRPMVTGFPVPFFSWIGFNDTASSALVSGALLLCANSLFRGTRLWLFGAPALRWNLTDFGFNDRASSGVAF